MAHTIVKYKVKKDYFKMFWSIINNAYYYIVQFLYDKIINKKRNLLTLEVYVYIYSIIYRRRRRTSFKWITYQWAIYWFTFINSAINIMISKGNLTFRELNMSRRSVNFFDKEKELDMRIVRQVITESFQAPSSYNLQPWRILLLKSIESKELLHSLAFKQEKILDAPITLIIVGDKEGYEESNSAWNESFEKRGVEKTNKTIESLRKLYGKTESMKLKFAESHGGLLSMNLMQLFKAYGIDTHPMSGLKFDEVKLAFNLKESEEVVMLMSVGYRDKTKQLSTRKTRKTYEEVVTEL